MKLAFVRFYFSVLFSMCFFVYFMVLAVGVYFLGSLAHWSLLPWDWGLIWDRCLGASFPCGFLSMLLFWNMPDCEGSL